MLTPRSNKFVSRWLLDLCVCAYSCTDTCTYLNFPTALPGRSDNTSKHPQT
jgi:hypothetical protein